MPTQRFSRLAPEAQRKMLDAARSEFARHGYDKASVNRIVQAAGINKGSLYYYFEDKADLFVTAVRDFTDEMIRTISGQDMAHFFTIDPDDIWSFLEGISIQKVAFARQHADLMRLSSEIYRLSHAPHVPPAIAAYWQEGRQLVCQMLHRAQERGAVRSDLPLELMTDLVFAVSEVWNRPLLDDPTILKSWDPTQDRAYTAPQVDLMRRMLGASKGDDVQ